jgi:hypothetical protein
LSAVSAAACFCWQCWELSMSGTEGVSDVLRGKQTCSVRTQCPGRTPCVLLHSYQAPTRRWDTLRGRASVAWMPREKFRVPRELSMGIQFLRRFELLDTRIAGFGWRMLHEAHRNSLNFLRDTRCYKVSHNLWDGSVAGWQQYSSLCFQIIHF